VRAFARCDTRPADRRSALVCGQARSSGAVTRSTSRAGTRPVRSRQIAAAATTSETTSGCGASAPTSSSPGSLRAVPPRGQSSRSVKDKYRPVRSRPRRGRTPPDTHPVQPTLAVGPRHRGSVSHELTRLPRRPERWNSSATSFCENRIIDTLMTSSVVTTARTQGPSSGSGSVRGRRGVAGVRGALTVLSSSTPPSP